MNTYAETLDAVIAAKDFTNASIIWDGTPTVVSSRSALVSFGFATCGVTGDGNGNKIIWFKNVSEFPLFIDGFGVDVGEVYHDHPCGSYVLPKMELPG